MKQKLTRSIFLITVLALLVSNCAGLFLSDRAELSSARDSLTEMLALVDSSDPAKAVKQFGAVVPDKRLTIVALDGTVLADTAADSSSMTNHADREEFKEAVAGGYGEATRTSLTTGVRTLYVAVLQGDRVVRAAMAITSVHALVFRSFTGFLVGTALALLLALFLSRKLAGTTAKPVEEAEIAVRQVDETLQSARSEFTANVTHELKTPLTSIKGFTDMLSSGLVKDPEDEKRFITMISVEVDRLIGLINDILKISELENIDAVKSGERADANTVCSETADFLAPVATNAGVEITVNGQSVDAAISPNRLREVVLNLMENAVKYNKPGGKVLVVTAEAEGKAIITVSDTGIGIPPEAQSHVFERFYRVDKGRSRATGGTGLGLAIVKHIVALYGGTIKLESIVDAGTTITVTLPKA